MPLIKAHLVAQSAVSGTITTLTTSNPQPMVNRYSTVVVLGNIFGITTVIPAQNFTNDSGVAVAAGGLAVPSSSGYFNVYVNGVLQRGGISTLTSANLSVNSTLALGLSVVLEVVQFTSTSNSSSNYSLGVTTTIQS